jgi:hypothetical protein
MNGLASEHTGETFFVYLPMPAVALRDSSWTVTSVEPGLKQIYYALDDGAVSYRKQRPRSADDN